MCLAIPGKVIGIKGEDQFSLTGRVDFGGVQKDVNISFVPDVKIGEYVNVHVGFAISKINPEDANHIFEYLRQMEEV